MTTKAADPFSVILRRKKIPMGLLVDSAKAQRMNLLETEAFADTFGGKVRVVLGMGRVGGSVVYVRACMDRALIGVHNPHVT